MTTDLNPDKCLRKKLQAAKRQKVEYASKGGGIVANLDEVSFELFRHTCTDFLNAPNVQIVRVDRDNANDNKGNIMQYTYTVHLQNNVGYTMNLYLTKCLLLINGNATMTFIDDHLLRIHEILCHESLFREYLLILGYSVNYLQCNFKRLLQTETF